MLRLALDLAPPHAVVVRRERVALHLLRKRRESGGEITRQERQQASSCMSPRHNRKQERYEPSPSPTHMCNHTQPQYLEAGSVVHPEDALHQVAQRVVPEVTAHVPNPGGPRNESTCVTVCGAMRDVWILWQAVERRSKNKASVTTAEGAKHHGCTQELG